jgi:endonuclease III related protein
MLDLYKQLKSHHAKKWELVNKRLLANWWPISGKFNPPELEIALGCILTQNTNWKNVEKALTNMIDAKLTTAKKIADCDRKRLESIIRPAGFFSQKSLRLKKLCKHILDYEGDFYRDVTREELLAINGIGNETADSILLYACGKPEFVIDAYTIRMLTRMGVLDDNAKYMDTKMLFESSLKKDAKLYREFHALIVEHAKANCKKVPVCKECAVSRNCMHYLKQAV